MSHTSIGFISEPMPADRLDRFNIVFLQEEMRNLIYCAIILNECLRALDRKQTDKVADLSLRVDATMSCAQCTVDLLVGVHIAM